MVYAIKSMSLHIAEILKLKSNGKTVLKYGFIVFNKEYTCSSDFTSTNMYNTVITVFLAVVH